ncbi:MAG: SGNH/GDSL hydrolase family protein [Alphaproteobacteria bacterium]
MFLKVGRGLTPLKGGRLVDTATKTAAVFGDSISAANMQTSGGTQRTSENVGYLTCYNVLSLNRMYFPNANNLGLSGDDTSEMLARKNDLSALTFDVCFVMGGTNDIIAQTSTATIISNLGTIYDYISNTLGKTLIALTILPRTSWTPLAGGQITTAKAAINTVNAWIMAQHGSRGGRVISANLHTSMDNGSGEAIANSVNDGIHPSPYGGMLNGMDIYNRLLPYYGKAAMPNFTTGNLLVNGTLTGTGGNVSTNFTGTCATTFTCNGSGGTGGRTASKNGDGSQRLVMAVTGGGTADTCRMTQSIISGFTVGETVYATVLVQISGMPVNIYSNSLQLRLTGTGVPTLANVFGLDKRTSADLLPECYTTVTPGKYLIQTPDLAIISGSSISLEWRYEMLGTSSVSPSSGTVDIFGAGLYKR